MKLNGQLQINNIPVQQRQNRQNSSAIARSIVKKIPYGKYMYLDTDQGLVWFLATVDEYNADCVKGELFATFVCELDASAKYQIYSIGLSPTTDIDDCFDSIQLVQTVTKSVGEEMTISITVVILQDTAPLFVGGDNQLVKACLGLWYEGNAWGVTTDKTSIADIPIYMAERDDVNFAACNVTPKGVSFEGAVDTFEIYETILCLDNVPVLRDNKKTWQMGIFDVPIKSGYGTIFEECDSIDSIQVDNNAILDFVKYSFGLTASSQFVPIFLFDCDSGSKVVTDPLDNYIAFVSNQSVMLCSVKDSVASILLHIPNDGYKIVDIAVDGSIVFYDGTNLTLYYLQQGIWYKILTQVQNLSNILLNTSSETEYRLTMTVGRDTMICTIDKTSGKIVLQDTLLDCNRIMHADHTRNYIDSIEGETYYLRRITQNYPNRATKINKSVKGRQLFAQNNGLYLYDGGRAFNTINDATIRDTGFGLVGQKVFLCGSYVILSHTDNMLQVLCFDRQQEVFVSVLKLGKYNLQSAAVSNGYIILVMESGEIKCIAHDNSSIFFTYDDAIDGSNVRVVTNMRQPNIVSSTGKVALEIFINFG